MCTTRTSRPTARARFSFQPTVAAARPNTPTIAVPSTGAEAASRPVMTSATSRPCRFAVCASGTCTGEPSTASRLTAASPTAKACGSLVRWWSSTRMPPRASSSSPAFRGQRGVGPYADRGDHQLCGATAAVGQLDVGGVDPARLHSGTDVDARLVQTLGHERGHLWVQRCEHLIGQLDDGHGDAALGEVLRQLQADEALTEHDRGSRAAGYGRAQRVDVTHGAQRQRAFDPGHCRDERCRPRREHQVVVAELEELARVEAQTVRDPRLPIDPRDLVTHPHIEGEAGGEALRRLQQQRVPGGDHAADVIGQAAVRERDLRPRSSTTICADSTRRRSRVAVDMPPATPPTTMTRRDGCCAPRSSAQQPREQPGRLRAALGGARGGAGRAGAALAGGHASQRVLDVQAATTPRRLAARAAGHLLAHDLFSLGSVRTGGEGQDARTRSSLLRAEPDILGAGSLRE